MLVTPELLTVRSPESAVLTQLVPFATNKLPVVGIVTPRLLPFIFTTLGFGYVPERSPLALPPGSTPVIVVFDTPFIRPLLSTVSTGT
jgi:hypothetical protein